MKNLFFISIIAFSMIACKKNSEQLSEKKSTADSQQLENSKTCYLAVIGQDTVKLAINDSKRNITGNLDFRNAETDGSAGTFGGTKSGETLKLKARTIAEGNISHNDIYLLQKKGKLSEGVGEILKLNDSTATFANPSKIDYTKSFIFNKVDCK